MAGCEAHHSLLSEYVKNCTIVKQFSKTVDIYGSPGTLMVNRNFLPVAGNKCGAAPYNR